MGARLMRVFFTGGAGKAGRHAIAHLVAQGHVVTNADRLPLALPGVANLGVDLTDAGAVFNGLSQFARGAEMDPGTGVPRYDAVVHFAAIPSAMLRPDNETYAANVLSTYNVLDAATKLGIRKVVIASSETTYGICFADGVVKPAYVPVDEDHPTVPQDSYAMSKVVNEVTARSFHARTGADIYALRINNVIEPHEYATNFPAYMVDRCLATDGLGYQVFNVANDDLSVGLTTEQVMAQYYQGVPQKRPMGRDETFYTCDKAKRLLGFQPRHSWREVLG
jgi:nucleoside-diphosphate-sugar epimerase